MNKILLVIIAVLGIALVWAVATRDNRIIIQVEGVEVTVSGDGEWVEAWRGDKLIGKYQPSDGEIYFLLMDIYVGAVVESQADQILPPLSEFVYSFM